MILMVTSGLSTPMASHHRTAVGYLHLPPFSPFEDRPGAPSKRGSQLSWNIKGWTCLSLDLPQIKRYHPEYPPLQVYSWLTSRQNRKENRGRSQQSVSYCHDSPLICSQGTPPNLDGVRVHSGRHWTCAYFAFLIA